MSTLTQFFLNPAYVLPGAALVLVPILIHILSRLRYKKVRFAAMEFLLESEELNRRRVVIEQLLLLLLRILAVLLIGLLIARLVLDPGRLLMLRGASMHHVVILDDSLSMRDQEGGSTVFHQALQILENMLVEGSRQPGTSRITLLSTTDPGRPIVADRTLDAAFVQEILPRLRNLTCSWRAPSPIDAINAARDILAADGGAAPHVHFLTDLRATDWNSRPDTVAALESLKTLNASVDLVAVVNDTRSNVVIQQLAAETLAVAQGIPWRMTVTLKNYSSRKATGLRSTVLLDGGSLPGRILIPDIEPGAELQVSHDVTFDSEGRHQIEVRLEDDALREDNRRFLAVEVTEKRLILIIDDEGQQEDASFVAAALSADPALTGLASEVRASQTLTSANLSRYDCIYLLNVRDLPADTTLLLTDYVRAGGGIIWFPGEQANMRWYSETLRDPSMKLFPVPIGTVHEVDPGVGAAAGNASPFLTPVFEEHPIFMVYNAPDSPFPDTVQIARWLQVTDEWKVDDTERADSVRTIMRLRTGQPVAFEHAIGKGRVLTFLIGAGRRWSNWPVAPASPGYVVTQLLVHQYLQRPIDSVESRELSEPIRLQWPISQFTENVEVYLPEAGPNDEPVAETFVRLQATLLKNDSHIPGETPSVKGDDTKKDDAASSLQELGVVIRQAERPGIYRLRRFSPDGNVNDLVMAVNVPTSESSLALADHEQITSQSELDHVRILESDAANSLGGSQAGRELRWLLLGLLIATLVAEQLLALRLSYHPAS
ncbi:MAG: BatA domain-containing protein [Planctomycetaceae bacterium]|nr:BatA domain-containing protein [Planctomycetaceae bacterium]